jgi:hypothetical protein
LADTAVDRRKSVKVVSIEGRTLRMPKQTFLRLVEDEPEVGGVFTPEDITIMARAFDHILSDLKLVARDDLAVRMVAKLVVECARNGERDPERLRQWVVGQYAPRSPNRPPRRQ